METLEGASPSVLLFDLDPASFIARELGRVLDTQGSLRCRYFDGSNNSTERLGEVFYREHLAASVITTSDPTLQRVEAAIHRLHHQAPSVPIVVATTEQQPQHLLELLDLGATDYLTAPFRPNETLPRLWRLAEDQVMEAQPHPSRFPEGGLPFAGHGHPRLVGRSRAFLEVVDDLVRFARCDATVLIGGETGTGKGLFARTLHYLGSRAKQPFVAINCGAMPETLIENELFGHTRAAFTGADRPQEGLVAAAEGGTLLLDEVDSLSPAIQVKLLRLLQEREYRRLGSTRTRQANVRVVAATNTDLVSAVDEGRFRQDLFYRLNVLPLTLPPLRERREDIPLLARRFLERHGERHHRPVPCFSSTARSALLLHDWPGNVRELENVLERAILLADSSILTSRDLHFDVHGSQRDRQASLEAPTFQEAKNRAVALFETNFIEAALLAHQGNITRAAQAVGKNRRAFWELIRKHHIDADGYRRVRAAQGS